MTERRRLSVTDKLRIMVRQAICPLCGEKLGSIDNVEFDHAHALALGGADDLDNLRAAHIKCHAVKTFGTKATTAGSDIHAIAKGKRLKSKEEEFRSRILAKGTAVYSENRTKWPKRRKVKP